MRLEKQEILQIVGALLAFAPQALVLKDVIGPSIPAEVVSVGYLMLTVGFVWEIILSMRK